MENPKILLSTVWHSGSEYCREMLHEDGWEVIFEHCQPRLFENREIPKLRAKYPEMPIATTFRHPYKVGASWANRYDMSDPTYQWHWYCLWAGWWRLINHENVTIYPVEKFEGEIVNSKGDPKHAHAYFINNELRKYYELIPQELLDFAQKIVKNYLTR